MDSRIESARPTKYTQVQNVVGCVSPADTEQTVVASAFVHSGHS